MARLLLVMSMLLLTACGAGTAADKPASAPDGTGLPGVAGLDALRAVSYAAADTAPAGIPLDCDGGTLYWDTTGAGVSLDSADAAGPLAYAVYRIYLQQAGANPRVRVRVTPGAWLLVADYGSQRWHVLGQASVAEADYSLGQGQGMISLDGYCYLAVVQDPGSAPARVLDITAVREFSEHPVNFYYVTTTGSDGADGSAGAPWQTLQHAADVAGPGSKVIVRTGEYSGFDVRTVASEAAPLVFQAEPGVSITSPNSVTGRDGINVENAAYVTLDGFTVSGIERAGIRAAVSEYVTVSDCRCLANGVWGIFTGFAEHLTLERNVCVASGEQHGIYTSNSGDYPVVRGNVLAGNSGCGLHMNGDISMGGDGVISHALIEGNVIFDNGVSGGSGINCDGVQDSTFTGNLLWLNHASGISLYQIDAGAPGLNNVIEHNIVVQAEDGRWCMNLADGSTGNTVRYNTFFTFHPWRGSLRYNADSLAGLASDYNVVFDRITTDDGDSVITLAQWQGESGQDLHSQTAAPDGFATLFPGGVL